jgi:hypothetical protein
LHLVAEKHVLTKVMFDARTEVTEHRFRVDPSLLGLALATPARRGLAMAVDGLAIAVLANAPGFVFGIAVALVLLRVTRGSQGGVLRRSARRVSRAAAAVVLFAVAISTWSSVAELLKRDGGAESPTTATVPTPSEGVAAATALLGFTTAGDEAAAVAHAGRFASALRSAGAGEAEIVEALNSAASSRSDRPWLVSAVDSMGSSLAAGTADEAVPEAESALPRTIEPVVREWGDAVDRGDTAAALRASAAARDLIAGDSLRALREAVQSERATTAAIATQLEQERERSGILAMLRTLLDDLGLGFGWGGLYFTGFLALWSGQTPGKRLLGIRVVRLDGSPIGWWAAFERFAGYAAGLATGLIGFVQIFWDDNRQAIQDKISETVVVRLQPPRSP